MVEPAASVAVMTAAFCLPIVVVCFSASYYFVSVSVPEALGSVVGNIAECISSTILYRFARSCAMAMVFSFVICNPSAICSNMLRGCGCCCCVISLAF